MKILLNMHHLPAKFLKLIRGHRRNRAVSRQNRLPATAPSRGKSFVIAVDAFSVIPVQAMSSQGNNATTLPARFRLSAKPPTFMKSAMPPSSRLRSDRSSARRRVSHKRKRGPLRYRDPRAVEFAVPSRKFPVSDVPDFDLNQSLTLTNKRYLIILPIC
jgi:hypothetical protein